MFFKKDKEPQNLDQILKQFEELKKEVKGISQAFNALKKNSRLSIQKVGIIRYNPFSGVGSDQSFSIALLDGNNNGIVITSLFSQDGNRVYGKSIENGNSEYILSEEEKKAISSAIKYER